MTEKLEHTCEPMGDDDRTCLACDVATVAAQLSWAPRATRSSAPRHAFDRIRSRLAESTRSPAVEAVELVEAKWIRCEERMPEPTERVFFVVDWRVYRGEFDGEEFMNAGMFSWASRDVSHWMHRPLEPALPAPPKEPARDE